MKTKDIIQKSKHQSAHFNRMRFIKFVELCLLILANSTEIVKPGKPWWETLVEVWSYEPTNAWWHHPLIMVGIDAHVVILQVKGILAELDMLKFIFVEVRPAPQPCINHMRKTFPSCHLRREHSIITTVPIHCWAINLLLLSSSCVLSTLYVTLWFSHTAFPMQTIGG